MTDKPREIPSITFNGDVSVGQFVYGDATINNYNYGRNKEQPAAGKGSLSEELATEEAMKYWDRLRKEGYVDDNMQPCDGVSRQAQMYIALCFADKLKLKSKWKPFEKLWGINNLAQEQLKFKDKGALPADVDQSKIDSIFRE